MALFVTSGSAQPHFSSNPTLLYATQCVYKWVSGYKISTCQSLPSGSQGSAGAQVSWNVLFWMTSIFSPAWEKKEVERQCSFGFELQLDPWPLSLRLGYQNTRPSARDCRASTEHGVNIIHLGSRIQTAIICYSHTQSYYLILESRQMEGGQSHPPLLSFAAPPFLCCAERMGT